MHRETPVMHIETQVMHRETQIMHMEMCNVMTIDNIYTQPVLLII